MPSLRSTLLAAALAVAATAQIVTPDIDPSLVEDDTKERWCNDQKITCPFICDQDEPRTTLENECWPETLEFLCVCGNNKPANVTEYTLTLPFYVCQEKGIMCKKDCGNDSRCAAKCDVDNTCGAANPKRANSTLSESLPDPTASQTSDDRNTIFTGRPVQGSDEGEGAAGALNVAGACSMAVVIGGLFAGFAML
jgi:hypothetical protein